MTRHRHLASGIAGVVAAAAALVGGITLAGGPASAGPTGPIDPTLPAFHFNVFTHGDATLTNNESEGPVAVGGNLTIGGTYQIAGNDQGNYVDPPDGSLTGLVVGKQVNFAASANAQIHLQANTWVKVGDMANSKALNTDTNNTPANTRVVPIAGDYNTSPRIELTTQETLNRVNRSPLDFDGAFTTMGSNSLILGGCANTATMRNPNGDTITSPIPAAENQIIVVMTANQTNVVNLTGADLDNIQTLQFSITPSASTPVLINVTTPATFSWSQGNTGGVGNDAGKYILYNFPAATDITQTATQGAVVGTIYAPFAALHDTSPSDTNGQVITASLEHGIGGSGGEMHSFPFDTTLSCDSSVVGDPSPSTSPSDPAPSPSTSPSDPAPSPSTSPSDPAPSPSTSPSDPAPSPSTSGGYGYGSPTPAPPSGYGGYGYQAKHHGKNAKFGNRLGAPCDDKPSAY